MQPPPPQGSWGPTNFDPGRRPPPFFAIVMIAYCNVSETKHVNACASMSVYCSTDDMDHDDWMGTKPTNPEAIASAEEQLNARAGRFERVLAAEQDHWESLDAVTMTVDLALRNERRTCMTELAAGKSILVRADAAAKSGDTTTLAATFEEFSAHRKKISTTHDEAERLCR